MTENDDKAAEVIGWLEGLRAKALTIHDGHGQPLADRCTQALALIRSLLDAAAVAQAGDDSQWEEPEQVPPMLRLLLADEDDLRPEYDLSTMPSRPNRYRYREIGQ